MYGVGGMLPRFLWNSDAKRLAAMNKVRDNVETSEQRAMDRVRSILQEQEFLLRKQDEMVAETMRKGRAPNDIDLHKLAINLRYQTSCRRALDTTRDELQMWLDLRDQIDKANAQTSTHTNVTDLVNEYERILRRHNPLARRKQTEQTKQKLVKIDVANKAVSEDLGEIQSSITVDSDEEEEERTETQGSRDYRQARELYSRALGAQLVSDLHALPVATKKLPAVSVAVRNDPDELILESAMLCC